MVDLLRHRRASILRGEDQLQLSGLADDVVLAAVLVSVCVSADDNGLSPSRDESWNVADHDWLAEDCSIENVPNGSIGGFPHLLKVEFLNSVLVRGDGCAFDSDLVLQHCVGAVNSNLIVSSVSVFDGQVVVFGLDVDVGVDVLLLDPVPNNLGHLVSVNVDNGASNFDFAEGSGESALLDSFL